ncbi:hypothetical protein GYMLUDRAFT_49740 [Collybiopsis luxurians FD-317 M1]|uniref:Uncharacterized protein n=1 Tax=Collybiopsis luxurians FD-317 M1 TaxID=944289 RepID=A0A0D0C515_9AGAR|nr:hypothetical protein GYMLUDRAFT_49740 [Collybiopsis luxurians FD-317 M1]
MPTRFLLTDPPTNATEALFIPLLPSSTNDPTSFSSSSKPASLGICSSKLGIFEYPFGPDPLAPGSCNDIPRPTKSQDSRRAMDLDNREETEEIEVAEEAIIRNLEDEVGPEWRP